MAYGGQRAGQREETAEPGQARRAPFGTLDDVDYRMIRLLRQDGRRSIADLAQQLHTSKPTIRKRLERLVSSGAVFLTAYVPYETLGCPIYLAIAVTVTPGRLEEVGGRIARLDEVEDVVFITGGSDIFVDAHAVDRSRVFRFVADELGGIAGIRALDISVVLAIEKHTHLWEGERVGGSHHFDVIDSSSPPTRSGIRDVRGAETVGTGCPKRILSTGQVELDALDRRIIEQLRLNGRARVVDIARSVGVPAQTTRNRMERLIGQGVVTVLARVNPQAIGLPIRLVGRLEVEPGSAQSIARQLATRDMVAFVGHLSGTFDLYIEAYARDEGMLQDFINQDIGQIDGVRRMQWHHVLHVVKRGFVMQQP